MMLLTALAAATKPRITGEDPNQVPKPLKRKLIGSDSVALGEHPMRLKPAIEMLYARSERSQVPVAGYQIAGQLTRLRPGLILLTYAMP